MRIFSKSTAVFQSVTGATAGKPVKVVPGACISVFLAMGIFASSAAIADNSRHDERLGGYTLSDQSMLGRYGDVNDEWVERASVNISNEKMSNNSKHSSPKKDARLGAFSMEDHAMLGHYGDRDDGY